MITIWQHASGAFTSHEGPFETSFEPTVHAGETVWIDLLHAVVAEDLAVERIIGVEVPTREEMSEIEVSSRLYAEHGAHYMSATIMYAVDSPEPQSAVITFILTDKHLVTVRYSEPMAFTMFIERARKGDVESGTPVAVLVGLLEAIMDREADLIERLQAKTERLAQTIFDIRGGRRTRSARFDVLLRDIGRLGELASSTRDSLLSLERLLTHLTNICSGRPDGKAVRQRLKTEARDIRALTDHVMHLSQRLSFMLDAAVGLVTIEQNQIIKLFSVAAVILLPPTLIASIYGMNFKHMPELAWQFGYPFALGLMVASALGFYAYFRLKGWL